jgi:CelD/BcsL family acetyltransferase involved in cellulose biosynthesis
MDLSTPRLETAPGNRHAAETGAEVRVARLESWESAPDLEGQWSDLLDRCPEASVFQTLPWHRCWWWAFGGGHQLFVVLAHVGTRLVGIAPMMVVRDKGALGLGRTRLHFVGSVNHASDYCDFIVDPEVPHALDALLREIHASSSAFDRIDLSHFRGHSPNWAPTLDFFRSRRSRFSAAVQAEAPARVLEDRDADLKAANKSSLKRHTAHFRKTGDLRFHRCASAPEILGHLERFFDQHKARWARTGSPSLFHDPAQQAFYRELAIELLRHGWLRFDVVLFNGTPLAFHFGFEYRRRFIWYKPAFDVEFASKSPGEVLIKFLLEDAIERRLEEFDFTVGSEAFKFRFSNQVRTVNRLIVFRSAVDDWTYCGMQRSKSLLKRLLNRKPSSRDDRTTSS